MNAALVESPPVRWLAFTLNALAGLTLMFLVMITCVDVFGRYLLNNPLTGATELIELGLGVMVFTVLPVISWRHEHIVVDMLDDYFSAQAHFLKNMLIHIASTIALYFLGQRLLVLGERSLEYEEITEFLHIPLGWSINFMGYMCWFSASALLTLGIYHLLKTYRGAQAT